MNVEKYIENIKEKVQKKIDALYDAANEAYSSWADTGYERYMKKKDRLEDEAEKLNSFIHPSSGIDAAWRSMNEKDEEIRKLKNLLFSVRSVVEDEMKYDFPDSHATRRLEEIVDKFKYEHGGMRNYEQ